jgi:hypothetical protein
MSILLWSAVSWSVPGKISEDGYVPGVPATTRLLLCCVATFVRKPAVLLGSFWDSFMC